VICGHQLKTDNQIAFYRRGALVVLIEAVANGHRCPFPNCNLVPVHGLFCADKWIWEVIRRFFGDAQNLAKFFEFGVEAIAVVVAVVVDDASAVTDCISIALNLNLLLLQKRLASNVVDLMLGVLSALVLVLVLSMLSFG